jgi:hypothetical protein
MIRILIPFLFFSALKAQPVEGLFPLIADPSRAFDDYKFPDLPESDTINLPLLDDFSLPATRPNPRFWTDNKVLINNRFSNNMPTIGVATFDGLDEFGYAYNLNRSGSDTLADVLTSRYLNLAPPNNNDIFLSFMYEPQGLGEPPNFEDSLVVEFWSPSDSAWEQVWSVGGDAPREFRSAIIPVNQPKWLQRGFRFRFGTYGSLQGGFDVWNVDYVRLDRNRNPADTTPSDPAFTRPAPPFTINNYRRVPWFHFANNRLRDNMTFTYNRRGPNQGYSLNLGFYRITKDGVLVQQRTNPPVINDPGNTNINFTIALTDFALNPLPTDEFLLEMKTWFTGTALGIQQNDTVIQTQEFKNYYAYDDGSAERAYGISNAPGAEMAIRFQPYQPDTLKGVFLSFTQAGQNTENRGFRIAVWTIDNGAPGTEIYLSDSVYFPDFGYGQNDFVPYLLDNNGLYISGPVFIGLKQNGILPLHLGYDRNSVNATPMFYSDGSFWYESILQGTVMLRPFFRYVPRDLSQVLPKQSDNPIILYPNPARDGFMLKGAALLEGTMLTLSDQTGRIVRSYTVQEAAYYPLHGLVSGLYFLTIYPKDQSGVPSTHKLLVQP